MKVIKDMKYISYCISHQSITYRPSSFTKSKHIKYITIHIELIFRIKIGDGKYEHLILVQIYTFHNKII